MYAVTSSVLACIIFTTVRTVVAGPGQRVTRAGIHSLAIGVAVTRHRRITAALATGAILTKIRKSTSQGTVVVRTTGTVWVVRANAPHTLAGISPHLAGSGGLVEYYTQALAGNVFADTRETIEAGTTPPRCRKVAVYSKGIARLTVVAAPHTGPVTNPIQVYIVTVTVRAGSDRAFSEEGLGAHFHMHRPGAQIDVGSANNILGKAVGYTCRRTAGRKWQGWAEVAVTDLTTAVVLVGGKLFVTNLTSVVRTAAIAGVIRRGIDTDQITLAAGEGVPTIEKPAHKDPVI